MSSHWTHQVAKSLSNGRQTAALETHLDDLLLWLSNPDHPRAADLDRAIARQRLARAQAAEAAYRLLDRLLFEGEVPSGPSTLGLAPHSDPGIAKQRYRRLMQVYHPDHHPKRTAWATRRTEQINLAFNSFRKGGRLPSGGKPPGSAGRSPRRAVNRYPGWRPEALFDHPAAWWEWSRGWLSGLNPVQRRWIALGTISLVLLIVISTGSEEAPKPRPKIIHHPLEAPHQTPAAFEEAPAQRAALPEAMRAASTHPVITDPAPGSASPGVESLETATDEVSAQDIAKAETPAHPSDVPPESTAPSVLTESVQPQDLSRAEPTQRTPTSDAIQERDEPPSVAEDASRPPLSPRLQPGVDAPLTPGMRIPPTLSPEAPTPPIAPEPPLQLSAAPIAPPVTPEFGATGEGCRSVPDILKRFQQAYQVGSLDRFMALYSPLAKENDLATWFAIRETYAQWFRQTSARQISFEQLQIKPIPDSDRCAALAVFKVSYRDEQSRLATKAGVIQLLFEPKGSELLILRVRY